MNRDLEETLNELGPEYRAVVARLKQAKVGEDIRRKTRDIRGRETRDGRRGGRSRVFRLSSNVLRPTLAAASLLALFGLTALFLQSNISSFEHSNIPSFEHSNNSPSAPREYRATVAEMIATQNSDGSWQNDFLTRRNAAALKVCGDPAAQIAYKKAMRNLRARGML